MRRDVRFIDIAKSETFSLPVCAQSSFSSLVLVRKRGRKKFPAFCIRRELRIALSPARGCYFSLCQGVSTCHGATVFVWENTSFFPDGKIDRVHRHILWNPTKNRRIQNCIRPSSRIRRSRKSQFSAIRETTMYSRMQ